MLKVCRPDLKLLTDREHLDIVESLIRGGVSCVYSKRLCRANNKFLPDYKPKGISSFIVMIDANNLYGGIMEKFSLPLGDFELFDKSEWTDNDAQETLQRMLKTPDDDDTGFIVEVDFSYPDHLHDLHSDFPLAPTKEAIDESWLSQYQSDLLDEMQIKKPPKVKKLIQTLFDKNNYTLHYQTLKLYVELGLVVTKLHRLHTIVVNKKSLSGYDDKRFIMNDQVSTLPYGHQSLRDDMFFRTIVNDPDWGSEDEESEKEQQQKTQQEKMHQPQDSTTQHHKNKHSRNNSSSKQAIHNPAAYTRQVSILFPTQVFISENIARTN